jgi:hypothetical protein
LIGCKNSEEDNPLSFIEQYSVNLTEPKGTTYIGDYFPLEEGYTINYTGSVDMLTEMTIPGIDPIEEPTVAPALGMLKVLALKDIPLNSGTIPLFPIVDLSEMQGAITADTSRYFNKDAEAVYVKAIKMSDGSYLEVEDPVYIKSSLVVGESWNTAPKMNMTELLAGELTDGVEASDMTLNAESKFFVVGHEMISLPIGTRCDMTTTAKLATIYHLIADTGIVHQNTTGPMNMRMSLEGQTITIKITINKSELNLASLGDDGFYKMSTFSFHDPMINARDLQSFKTQTNQKIWKVSQTLTNLLIKKFSF